MAVSIRLRRQGKRGQPSYRVVASDKRSKQDGRFIEILGSYNPLSKELDVKFNDERCLYWLSQGAIPTDTVRSLMRKTGLWKKWSEKKTGVQLKEEKE